MKTPSEAAREYAKQECPYNYDCDINDHCNSSCPLFLASKDQMKRSGKGFLAGVAWAEQWISVEYELPKEGKVVLTKVDCEKADNINYQVATYIKQANLWITAVHSAIGIPQCFDTVDDYTPTHWRAIEHGKE